MSRRRGRGAAARCVLAALLSAACGLVACGDEPVSLDAHRLRIEAARASGNPRALHAAAQALAGIEPASQGAWLELAALWLAVGDAPRAAWLLDDGLRRLPGSDALRVERARVALVLDDPTRALGVLAPITADSPHDLAARLLRARAQVEQGDLAAGLALLEAARARDPDSDDALASTLRLLLAEQDGAGASALIARERGLREGVSAALLDLLAAQLALRGGEIEDGLARMARLAQAHADEPFFTGVRIRTLARLGRSDEALAVAGAAVARAPDDPALRSDLALVYELRGEPDRAERELRALVARADAPEHRLRLAQAVAAGPAPERAAQVWAEAVARYPERVDLRVAQVEHHLDAGRLDAADAALAGLAARQPDSPHVDYLEGRLALARGAPGEAASALRRAVADLDRAATQYWLGRSLEAAGDRDGAMRRYGLAAARDPRDPRPREAGLRLALARGHFGAAVEASRELARLAPGDVAAQGNHVALLLRVGRTDEAAREAEALAARAPDEPDALLWLARTRLAQGRFAAVESALDRAAAGHGSRSEIARSEIAQIRGELAAARGDLRAALRHSDDAIALAPERASLHASRARWLLASGEQRAGFAVVDRALALAPDDPAPLALRGLYRGRRGDLAGALADLERALVLRPEQAELWVWVGELHRRRGERERAVEALRRAIELDADRAGAHNDLALLLAEAGQETEALQLAQRAYALAPEEPAILDTLGWLYLGRGLVPRSIALLERAHAEAPRSDEVQLHLALAYRAAARPAEARRLLAELVERAPPGSPVEQQSAVALRTLAR